MVARRAGFGELCCVVQTHQNLSHDPPGDLLRCFSPDVGSNLDKVGAGAFS